MPTRKFVVLILFGLLCVLLGFALVSWNSDLRTNGTVADGKVIDVRGAFKHRDTTYMVRLPSGEMAVCESEGLTGLGLGRGDQDKVLYVRYDPTRCQRALLGRGYVFGYVLAAFGVLWIVVTLARPWFLRRRVRAAK